jgi:poly(3-hydroxybutyrate) depolymerase
MPESAINDIPPLPSFAVTPGGNSISGLSSGAFMTVQLHLAFSGSFIGAGIIAGGPYRCAEAFRGSALLAEDACALNALFNVMSPLTPAVAPKPAQLAEGARAVEAAGRIDPLANLATHRLYIFTGTNDTVLSPQSVRATRDFYRALGVPDNNIRFIDDIPAGHSIITSNPEDLPLGANQPPFINYGGAPFGYRMQSHDLLEQIYGDLNPPAARLAGELLRFDQREFIDDFAGASMNPYGYAYIPSRVLDGHPARGVHIALHGCKQGCAYVTSTFGVSDALAQPPYGNRYIATTGYNGMAESNDLIVLYPQAVGADGAIQNPEGCWDWWGYTDAGSPNPDYYSRQAVQIAALHKMLVHVSSGRAQPMLPALHAEALS